MEFPGLQTGATLVACPPGRPRKFLGWCLKKTDFFFLNFKSIFLFIFKLNSAALAQPRPNFTISVLASPWLDISVDFSKGWDPDSGENLLRPDLC
jgi:hypothetical protein